MQMEDRWFTVRSGPGNGSIETWLNNFENIVYDCNEINLPDTQGDRPVRALFEALYTVDQPYAAMMKRMVVRKQEALSLSEAIQDVKSHIATTQQFSRKSSRGEAAFATFQGQSDQGHNQRQQSRTKSRNDYLCGEKHLFSACPYVNESIRPKDWKPSIEILQRFDKTRKGSSPLSRALQAAERQAKAEQKPEGKPTEYETPIALFSQAKQDIVSTVHAVNQDNKYILHDSFIADSGADAHVCNNRSRFITFQPADHKSCIRAGNSMIKVEGYGTVEVYSTLPNGNKRILLLEDTLYVPDFHTSVVSLSHTKERGFYHNQCFDVIEDKDEIPLCKLFTINKLEVIEFNPIPEHQNSAFALWKKSKREHISIASEDRWHVRLGHVHNDVVRHLEDGTVGVKVTPSPQVDESICEPCRILKASRQISRREIIRAKEPFEEVHFDMIQMTEAYNSHVWATHFICCATGWNVLYTSPHKNQLVDHIKHFIEWVKQHFGYTVKRLFSDQDPTLGNRYKKMAEEYRVQIIHSAAHTSNQNGKIERAGGVIIARSRSLIIHAKIPRELWPEAMQAAVYLINRTPVRDRSVSPERWISPYERLYGQKPNLANIRVFGCKSYVLRHDVAKADKMAPRAWIGYLVGFEASNLWRIWNPRAVRSDFKVTSQQDVTFNETEFYDPQKPLLDDILVSEIPRVVELNEPTEQISQRAIEPQGSEIESDSENEQTE
jgi:hypothetical protein